MRCNNVKVACAAIFHSAILFSADIKDTNTIILVRVSKKAVSTSNEEVPEAKAVPPNTDDSKFPAISSHIASLTAAPKASSLKVLYDNCVLRRFVINDSLY